MQRDPYSLANVATSDSYGTTATLADTPVATRIVLQVYNAAVYYQLQDPNGAWYPETFLAPFVGTLSRVCIGIRFRSALAGTPAQVSVELVSEDRLGDHADSGGATGIQVSQTGQVTNIVSVPTGGLVPYAGSAAPSSDWLLCDGSNVSRATYAQLFGVIGITYGAGDGSTTFGLPDLRGRVPVGVGPHTDVSAPGNSEGSAAANRRPKHPHSNGLTLPNHGHSVSDPGHTHTVHSWGNAIGGGHNGFSSGLTTDGNVPDNGSVQAVESGATGVSVGNPTTTPAINGSIGAAGTATDAPAYLVLNYLIRAS